MAGGALGATPTQTGQVANTSGGFGMGGLGPTQGPAQGAMPTGGGLPMSPMDGFLGQANQQQQYQQFNQPPAGGFGSLGLGTIQQTAQNNPTSTEFSPFGSGDMSVMGDNGRLSGQGNNAPSQSSGQAFSQLNSILRGQQQQSQNPFSETGMEGSPSYSTFSKGMQGYTSPQQLNTLTGLYSGSGDAGIDPRVQQAKQQGFGFGGAYGQQAQARMQSQYQPQQSSYQQQPQFQGLQQLFSRMMSGYQNRPQSGAQSTSQSMPAYTSAASSYKPDFLRAQEALNRTATTKAEADAAAAAAAQAKLDAQAGLGGSGDDDADFRAWQRRQYEASKYNYGG